MVEDVDVGDAHRILADLGRRPRGAGLQIGLPPQPVDVGGALQALEEVVGDAGRALGFAVDVDPERLGLDQPALASVDAHPHLTPAVGRPRTPAAHPQHVLELDGLDQVDHRAAHDPQRVRLLEPHLAQLVRADVLDVAGGGVELQPARRGRCRRPAAATRCRRRRGAGRAPASSPSPGRIAWISHRRYSSRRQILPQADSIANTAKAALRSLVRLSDVAKTFVGSRVRQLRSERGFSQAALAQMLEISPSYLNQIEHDVRPLTVAVLLRITEVFGVDATFFASQDDTRLVAELREVTMDRDLDIDVDLAEVADMVSAHPDAGPGDGQPAPALPHHHHATGRRHRGPVLRRQQRQRRDHDAARGGPRLLLSAAELPARARHRRRGSHHRPAHAPRRPCPRSLRPADQACTACTSCSASTSATPCCTATTRRPRRWRSAATCRRASRCSRWPPNWPTSSSAT